MEGEQQRKRRRGFGSNILLCNHFSVVGVLHLLKMEEKTALQLALRVLRVLIPPIAALSLALWNVPVAKQRMWLRNILRHGHSYSYSVSTADTLIAMAIVRPSHLLEETAVTN